MARSYSGVDVVESEVGGGGAEASVWGVYVQVHGVEGVVVKTRKNRVASAKS